MNVTLVLRNGKFDEWVYDRKKIEMKEEDGKEAATGFNLRRDLCATFEAEFDAVKENVFVEVGGLGFEHHGQLFRRSGNDQVQLKIPKLLL